MNPLVLGAPGILLAPPVARPRVAAEPMDVAAFVGVAPRGPAYERVDDPDAEEPFARSVAVAVDSWDAYAETFGGFAGPGLLPHAVAAYFAQGGRRAYVVRIVARAPIRPGAEPPGCARYLLPGAGEVRARTEGTWGDRLTLELRYGARPLAAAVMSGGAVVVEPGSVVPVGALLRFRGPAGPDALAAVAGVDRVGRPGAAGRDVVLRLDRVVAADEASRVELVEAELTVTDHDPERPRHERFTGLGTWAAHPRYLPDVLHRESRLLAPVGRPAPGYDPGPDLGGHTVAAPHTPGVDRWALIDARDVLDGVSALAVAPEVASLVVPDLWAPAPLPPPPPPDPPSGDPAFRPCLPVPPARVTTDLAGPAGLALDPADPAGFRELLDRQLRLVAAAQGLGLVALLDVPPVLRGRQVLRWRSSFDSSFAAAYHPWLRVPGPDPGAALVDLPPSAVAAGIIARCELRSGISRGPANETAAGAVDLTEPVDDATHDELHRLGIDVFRIAPGGVVLTGARTLSGEPGLRQLTVRRLLSMVRRAVARRLAWAAFEPADDRLRAGLRRHLDQLLGDLFDAGAFAGATPEESWFVRVGAPHADGEGRLVVEVGMAPAQPLEFVVVRVVLDAEGAVEPGIDVGGVRRG